MEKDKLESLLIDYIDGKLAEPQREEVTDWIRTQPDVKALFEQLREVMTAMDQSPEIKPSDAMRKRFETLLHEEIVATEREIPGSKQVWFQPTIYRVAAAVLLVVSAVGVGYWINASRKQAEELAALKKEMEQTKAMMMAQLDNRQSASQRLLGVSVAYEMEQADDEIVNALTKAMNEDPNTNVRLAALEALGKFQTLPHVRQALIQALATQTDPVVQIELIRLMVEMKEKEALKELERITTDELVLPAVKDEAHAGILRLS